jgi:hypothetical protein
MSLSLSVIIPSKENNMLVEKENFTIYGGIPPIEEDNSILKGPLGREFKLERGA